MPDKYAIKPSLLFWVLAVLFVLWGIFGCVINLVEFTMSDAAYEEAWGPDVAAVRDQFPIWGLAAYTIAVWSGLLAAILFILRKRVSVSIFILSLFAAIIGFIPSFTSSTLKDAYGPTFWVMPLIVVTIGIFEIFYSRKQAAKGILR